MSGRPLANDRSYKVVVWATGGVGKYAIRTIANRPNLELVGAWVHSAQKDGQDVGTLAGIDPVGVTATRDKDALLSGDADCVMYAGPAASRPKEALEDFCRILASGKNIVTTSAIDVPIGCVASTPRRNTRLLIIERAHRT